MKKTNFAVFSAVVFLGVNAGRFARAVEPGSPAEPVRYTGSEKVDLSYPDGGLRPAVGVQNYQVLRANRSHPRLADGYGWTYNHQPYLAYWNGKFYLEYLSNPVGEHIPPGHTLLTSSVDGAHWEFPVVVFPDHAWGEGDIVMHQRMGFYVAPNGRLLVLGFYGLPPTPNDGTGIGRVVREVKPDGSFGPIYFIRYNMHSGWNENNTDYPFYAWSDDRDFKAACNALLGSKLMTQQWWEEDRSTDGFYAVAGRGDFSCKALCFYHRKDGKVVGLWKGKSSLQGAYGALSSDGGHSWSTPVVCPTIPPVRSKHWGQRTDDGRYALVYGLHDDDYCRYPLVVTTSKDGIRFDQMAVVHGEMPRQRFAGNSKDVGPQYVRGIAEGNGNPPGNDLWVTYSVNKEDIWVSRIPVPIRRKVEKPVSDTFDEMEAGGVVAGWNIYSPKWASVEVVDFPGPQQKSLRLQDKDPYDYARAVRVFPESTKVKIHFKVLAKQTNTGRLEIEVLDSRGSRPVRTILADDGKIKALTGDKTVSLIPYSANVWFSFSIEVDVLKSKFSLAVNGEKVLANADFAEPVMTVERFSLRTGHFRGISSKVERDAPNPDDPVRLAAYYIDEVMMGK